MDNQGIIMFENYEFRITDTLNISILNKWKYWNIKSFEMISLSQFITIEFSFHWIAGVKISVIYNCNSK